MPWSLHEMACADAKRIGYANIGRYFVGLSVSSILTDAREKGLRIVGNQNPKDQDHFFACMELFLADANELIKALGSAKRKNPPVKRVIG